MNYLMIQKLSDLNTLFHEQIILNQNQQDEIENNLWILSFDEKVFYTLTSSDLEQFLEKLLAYYKALVLKNHPTISAIFYLWLDPQTLQLRFNILSKTTASTLPFACKINIGKDYAGILQSFLDTNNQFMIEGDVIEEVDEFGNEEDNDNFVLEVYAKQLNN